MQTDVTSISVLNHDTACNHWLRSSSTVDVFKRASVENAAEKKNIFVLVAASQLQEVAAFVRAANKVHHLQALLVHADIDATWIGQILDKADLRTLRNLFVHRGGEQPRRILNAWRIGAQDELIADAVALQGGLLVLSCAMKRIEVPWSELQEVSRADVKSWGALQVAEDGSYLHWPGPDIHLDFRALQRMVDPAAREAASVERLKSLQGFGAAVAALRRAAGLTQSAIEGVTARQVRRIESGEVFPRVSTLAKLAAAHGQSTGSYLERLAREQKGSTA
jgi:hypothetical protein